jgi:type I restriction-modification system DNA methylase subunit
MHPLENYLAEIAMLRGATKETSGYGVLQNLLNAVGHTLKPKVRCIIHPKNSGAGIPDGGLFLPDQLKNRNDEESFIDQKPARGVIEVKSTRDEITDIAETKQVKEYLEHYGLVLLTNYRSFLLLKRGDNGKPIWLESFQLAPDEKSFWLATVHPRKAANELGERFLEYLKRVMLHAAPLNNPKDVAFFLASYARDARARVEATKDLPQLAAVRTALEEALGMKFTAGKGEHFFRSTLVQTLFYGVFSAWVLWHKEKPQRKDAFDWKSAAWTLHVPIISALFHQVADPLKLRPLGLDEILDWTSAALNRVIREEFFVRFVEDHAVQYFYEPFLEEFDPELRKELGVWYTPPEIVQYQVARVDAALRDKDGLNIPDGLADPSVFVLDPCCGTGAYLVEVLRKIEKTLKENKGEDALATAELKEAAMKRVFGFEIMPAPFVVSHLQMGLLLQNLAVPLDDAKGERAGIFLTNSLTGWDENMANPYLANWPELEAERRGAGKIKQEKPILVILGNPPYNAYAGISPQEEQGLVEIYKVRLLRIDGRRIG